MISWILLLKFMSPIITALMVTVLAWIEREQKSRLFLWGTILFAFVLLIPTLLIIYQEHQASLEAERELANQTALIQKSLALQGDKELLKLFVESQRELINRASMKDSQEFLDELFSTYDKKMEQRQGLSIANKKLASKYMIRLEPLKAFILSELDQRMEYLIHKEKVLKIEKNDFESVLGFYIVSSQNRASPWRTCIWYNE